MKSFSKLLFLTFCLLIVFFQSKGDTKMETTQTMKKLQVRSSAFEHNEMIPSRYTCDGEDVSPPLSWDGVPQNAKSLALISDDPDAPMGTWVHWVAYNIPPSEKGFPENLSKDKKLPNGTLQGITDFKRIGYGGPCPPSGVHRYFFKLYALDTKLNLDSGASKKDLLKAMEGHILAQGELMGKYQRKA